MVGVVFAPELWFWTLPARSRKGWLETAGTRPSVQRHRPRLGNARHSDALTHRGAGSVVPEPSTYVLLASGRLGLAGVARRKKQQG